MREAIEFLKNWRRSAVNRKHLDSLLTMTPSTHASIRKRLDWFADLIQWVRSTGQVKTDLNFKTGTPQATRVKYALLVLQRNPKWKSNMAQLLRSIIQDANALELYLNTGIANQAGVVAEAIERIQIKFLPTAGNDQDLASIFTQTFRFENDATWIEQIDGQIFSQIIDLFLFEAPEDFLTHNRLIIDAREALFLLAYQVGAMGLHSSVRNRASYQNFREIPFFQLPHMVQRFLESQSREEMAANYGHLEPLLKRCSVMLQEVYSHMDEHGVGVELVYQLDRIDASLNRMKTLAELLCSPSPKQIQNFVSLMIAENVRSRSMSALMADSLSLISRKISETSAETGEHYITRNKTEYMDMVKRALGGGFMTGFTTLIKLGTSHLPVSPFVAGVVASSNYAISFVAMQLLGFTLATKQPAMTASAMADQMNQVSEPQHMELLIDEIVCLIRSQVAAVFGNIVAVVPTMVLICLSYQFLFSEPLMNTDKATYTLKSFSLLGMTPFYAAFTGVLLFSSSLFSGWINNWVVYRRLPTALAHDRRLVFTIGADGARKFSLFIKRNVAGFAGNVSLGFLLGMTPFVADFFGLPLDVRHVTLSSGGLTAAMMTLGSQTFAEPKFWLAVGGIISMAVLNLLVSFALAMTVAIRAKKIKAPQRSLIYANLWQRVKTTPFAFLWPPKKAAL